MGNQGQHGFFFRRHVVVGFFLGSIGLFLLLLLGFPLLHDAFVVPMQVVGSVLLAVEFGLGRF